MNRLPAALLVVAILVSGCAGTPASPRATPTQDLPAPIYAPPAVDEDTGGIDGTVVSDELVPIPNATVGLLPPTLTARTDAFGRFAFGHLTPGSYDLAAQALGYDSHAVRVEVVAGKVTQTRMTLAPLAANSTYTATKTLNGHTTCTISYRSSVNFLRPTCSLVPGAFPNDRWNMQYDLKAGMQDLLVETSWRPTYSYGNQLFQIVHLFPFTLGAPNIKESEGPNPIRIPVTHDEFVAWDAAQKTNYTVAGGPLSLSTFAAHNLVGKPSPAEFGLLLDQSFTVYSTTSFNGPMPAKYTAIGDQ